MDEREKPSNAHEPTEPPPAVPLAEAAPQAAPARPVRQEVRKAEESPSKGRMWDLKLVIFVLGLVVSAASFVATCLYQSHLSALERQINAVQYRPLLHIRGFARIDSCTIAVPVPLEELLKSQGKLVERPEVAELHTTLRVVNTGSAIAKVVSVAAGDTIFGGTRLRQILLSKESRESQSQVSWHEWTGFYQQPDILPGDSASLSFTQQVQFQVGSEFTLHYLVLYKNELGDLYDTYYWVRGHADSVPLMSSRQPVPGAQNGTMGLLVKVSMGDLVRSIKFTDSNEAFYVYRQEDARAIHDWAMKALRRR